MTSTSNELAAFAAVLAREAGELLLEYQLKRHELATETKSSPTDLVSTADRASETLVRKRINERFPTDGIVGEEQESRVGTSGREWIVDPLDGTTNFLFGVPTWAVSIACHDSTGPLVGCVLDPSRDELFSAARGEGSRLNGELIAVSERGNLAHALIATGFNYDGDMRRSQAAQLATIIDQVRDVRRGGAASLDLAWVAAGRVDGFYEAGLGPWDWAAGALLVSEAGGTFAHAPSPHGPDQLVATNGKLGAELQRLVSPRK